MTIHRIILALTIAFLGAFLGAFHAALASATPINMRVYTINDHVMAFYDGRPDEASIKPGEGTWADFGANYVGVATYVIHRGDHALVYDTFPSAAQAQWVRDYLEKAGIHQFVVVNSHWHLDHVGGNTVYADSAVIGSQKSRDRLIAAHDKIEHGTQSGPPAIVPLTIPAIAIGADTTVYVGDIRVELRPVNIHSADGLVMTLPADGLLFAGDTLEDTVTFISEPENIPEHIRNLAAMKQWGMTRILPNHGDPAVIARGGYGPALIDFTRAYLRRMIEHAHDGDFVHQPVDAYIAQSRGTVSLWWAYRDAHQSNLNKVAQVWKDRAIPDFGPNP